MSARIANLVGIGAVLLPLLFFVLLPPATDAGFFSLPTGVRITWAFVMCGLVLGSIFSIVATMLALIFGDR